MKTDSLILYSYYRSSTAYRVRIALNFKGLVSDQKTIHLLEDGGAQNKPEYRALNPTGEVPTLIHNGKIISQSVAIIEYLEEICPSPALYPTSAYDRAKVRQICENINSGIHPIVNLKVQQFLAKEYGITDELRKNKWMLHWLEDGLGSLEKILSTTADTYAYGDKITAADVFLIPQIFSARRFQVDINQYPTLQRVNTAVLKLEPFYKAHPHLQPDTPSELLGKV